jgi:hypothetical protein
MEEKKQTIDSFSYEQRQREEREKGVEIINRLDRFGRWVHLKNRERERERVASKVLIGPSLEPNLPKSKHDEQSEVPRNQPQPAPQHPNANGLD